MKNYLSIPLDNIKYKRDDFVKSIVSQISKPLENNTHYFEISHTAFSDTLRSNWGISIEEVYQNINKKVQEWIDIWNINNQYSEIQSLLFDPIEVSKENLIHSLCSKVITKHKSIISSTNERIDLLGVAPSRPELIELPKEPKYNYDGETNFILKLLFKKSTKELYNIKFPKILSEWKIKCEDIRNKNSNLLKTYEENFAEFNSKLNEYESLITECEDKISYLEESLSRLNDLTINECIKILFDNINLPYPFKNEFDWELKHENNILLIDFLMPSPDDFYKNKNGFYKDFKTKGKELKFIPYKEKEFNEQYDRVLIKSQLIIIHYIFLCDTQNKIDFVTINGWVNHLDKSIGKYSNKCITSLSVKRSDFIEINIERVDPVICFKGLKGISAAKLLDVLPIVPLISLSKNDKRFVQNKEIISSLNEGVNLSEMDWEDFEHLIRELFEKEFSINGGEVKITQASRDGGVDAIAFDPDPIRGGKVIIQAKRYNNIVGVSAVRDLYGTTLNEGANKGILVTTSNYGSDAYEFAKGKPITLLNGGNLLSLLEKHGYNAQIKLKQKKLN